MKIDEEYTKVWSFQFSKNELIDVLLTHINKETGTLHDKKNASRIEVRGDSKEITVGLSLTMVEKGDLAHDTKNPDVPRQVKRSVLEEGSKGLMDLPG